MKKNVKKITVGGLLIALALVLPMAFHLTGVPQPGQVFLPMHIPVLLGGFVLGPVFGFFVGLFSPIISSVLTGMPAVVRLPFMMIEDYFTPEKVIEIEANDGIIFQNTDEYFAWLEQQ